MSVRWIAPADVQLTRVAGLVSGGPVGHGLRLRDPPMIVRPYLRSASGSGTRQSRSCGLKKREGSLWVAGVVSVGCGDVVVAVEAEQADREAA